MRDRGWRPVKIVEARPAESRYVLEGKWLLRLRLEIVGVVKNENYRTPLVMPHYVARWATWSTLNDHRRKAKKYQSRVNYHVREFFKHMDEGDVVQAAEKGLGSSIGLRQYLRHSVP